MDNKELNKFRSEELHKVALSSFVQGSYELDKTILNLSVGSLGFILTFATTFEYSKNSCLIIFIIITFIIALCGFGYTIYNILDILKLNKEYFKKIISDDEENSISGLEYKMERIDNLTILAFKVSIFFSSLFILLNIINKNL